jgi:hypothetical protein
MRKLPRKRIDRHDLEARWKRRELVLADLPYKPPRRINFKGIAIMDAIRDRKEVI